MPDKQSELSKETMMRVLFETYESLYDVDVESGGYQCHYESEHYGALDIETGDDFFAVLTENIYKTVYPEDQEYVRGMMDRDLMLSRLKKEKFYSFVYRLMMNGGPVYHKIRATLETVDGREHIFIGVRNVDETIKQEQKHTDALASMHQKEKNHLEAILASAAGYLESNLSANTVIDVSPGLMKMTGPDSLKISYSKLNERICSRFITVGAERYRAVSEGGYLMRCFGRGERRASVTFSAKKPGSDLEIPFRTVFYLYRDDATQNVIAFSVVYDLTEHQRREKELRELEDELRMSRIHNFTSQMQPHFLYNALGSIQEVLLDDPHYAYELIGDFSVHLRSCVRAMENDDPLPFSLELENIKAYVNIERMRFGSKLRVKYDIKAADFNIIPLSIQPLVENAIRHGVYERGRRGGTVVVRTREYTDAFVVEVEDDGVGFDVSKYTEEQRKGVRDSTGLKNITFRLEKTMNASVNVHSVPGRGTTVTVTIPKGEIK